MKISISILLYVLCLCALIVFLVMPENKYEWMIEDETIIMEKAELPVDHNAGVRQAVYFVPVFLFAFITLLTSRKIHSKKWFIITAVYCFMVLTIAMFKMVF